jgi:hypothetical protein
MEQPERGEGHHDEPSNVLRSETTNEPKSIRRHSKLQDATDNIEEGKTVHTL